jgi:hypothetical protein
MFEVAMVDAKRWRSGINANIAVAHGRCQPAYPRKRYSRESNKRSSCCPDVEKSLVPAHPYEVIHQCGQIVCRAVHGINPRLTLKGDRFGHFDVRRP